MKILAPLKSFVDKISQSNSYLLSEDWTEPIYKSLQFTTLKGEGGQCLHFVKGAKSYDIDKVIMHIFCSNIPILDDFRYDWYFLTAFF